MKKALITGINGQDGILLSRFLLTKKYKVFGIEKIRKKKKNSLLKIKIFYIDLQSKKKVRSVLNKIKPNEIYHLADNSVDKKKYFYNLNKLNTSNNILYNLLDSNLKIGAKFFYACSSEIYGNAKKYPQNENTSVNPRSLYGLIKLSGLQIVKYYRQHHKQYACSGILYNHESFLRKNMFLIKQVVNQANEIYQKKRNSFNIKNIYDYKDWSDARDFVRAFWQILKQTEPDDYVISSQKKRSVYDVLKIICKIMNLKLSNYLNLKKYIKIKNPTYLVGKNTKIKKIGWKPKIKFEKTITDIIHHRY